MYLNDNTAKEIIKEISPFIPYDLNLMDGQGLILASTNPGRIGTHHDGAKKLIGSGEKQLIVRWDGEYEGCKEGVNLPIYYAGLVIGVVGITGNPQETIKYGQIIQKMTEMMVYENLDASQKLQKENTNFLYMNDVIHGNWENSLFNLEEWMNQSGLQSHGPFTVCVFALREETRSSNAHDIQKVRESIIKNFLVSSLRNKQIICASDGEHYICLGNRNSHAMKDLLSMLGEELLRQYSISLLGTIGNTYQDLLDIPKSYREAVLIQRHFANEKAGIYCFENIVLELVFQQIPDIYKKNISEQVFRNCTMQDVKEHKELISSYIACNGSLKRIAEQHFIHKNTVQYKLHKITRLTGLDPRNYKDLLLLHLACLVS
jgi:carbohydrate diacid regulator